LEPSDNTDSEENEVRFFANPDFPGREAGLDVYRRYKQPMDEERVLHVAMGPYSHYGRWREYLAILAGWQSAEQCFEATSGPFWELINFSDCEGVIGPVAAKKLAEDFRAYRAAAEQVKAPSVRGFLELYEQMARACELAADGGAIAFH
jgi:hypothetical protein